jgi:hypothetical protein
MRQYVVYNPAAGQPPLFSSDTANTPSTAVERDAAGAINVGQVNPTVLNPSAALYLPRSAVLTATGTLDALSTVKRCDATSGNQIQTLPPAAGVAGLMLIIKRLDSSANTCTLKGNAVELIDAANTLAIGALGRVPVISNGTGWDIVG